MKIARIEMTSVPGDDGLQHPIATLKLTDGREFVAALSSDEPNFTLREFDWMVGALRNQITELPLDRMEVVTPAERERRGLPRGWLPVAAHA